MKKIILYLTIFLITSSLFAQQGINYKAVIKDNSGNVIANDLIVVQFTIIKTSVGGTTVYQESHSPTTDANGIIILNIGEGIPVSGVFNTIDWGSDAHFFNVQINTGGGLVDMGTTAFKTVPYAKHALTVENGVEEVDDLSDAIYDGTSLFIGNNAGINDEKGNYNTAIGKDIMKNTTSGRQNAAIGAQTLLANETGNLNVAVGSVALYNNISGNENVALGEKAGFNSLGDGNIFLGKSAGFNETGSNKLYIENSGSATPLIGGDFSTNEVTINGAITIVDGTQGVDKVLTSDASGKASWKATSAFGATELNNLSDAVYNGSSLFIGNNVGTNNTTGVDNVGLGKDALQMNTTGFGNTAIGSNSLENNFSGSYNTAVGSGSLDSNDSGNSNTALGIGTLSYNISGFSNTAIGRSSLSYNEVGSNNTAIGHNSGRNSIGSENIFLGYNAGYNETGSNKLYIENTNSSTPLIGGDFSTDKVTINGSLEITDEVIINGDLEITENIQGKIKASDSGNADMKAYVYGSVSWGNILLSKCTSGFSFLRESEGKYRFTFTGTNQPTDTNYIVLATRTSGDTGFIKTGTEQGRFYVFTYDKEGWSFDEGCFSFVVYKI